MKFSCLLLLLNFIVLLFAEPIPDTVFATHLAKSVAEAPNRELTLLHKRASPDFQHSLQMFASNQMNLGTFLATQDMAELSSWASSSITSLQKGGCGLVS